MYDMKNVFVDSKCLYNWIGALVSIQIIET